MEARAACRSGAGERVTVQSIETGSTLEGDSRRRAVLIVDDDRSLLGLIKAILQGDYEVLVAEDGLTALDVAGEHDLDAIVLDLRMPGLDGPGFFQQLRERGDRTPVLLASSHGARRAQQELGAEGAIEKPFEPDDLLEAVDALIH